MVHKLLPGKTEGTEHGLGVVNVNGEKHDSLWKQPSKTFANL